MSGSAEALNGRLRHQLAESFRGKIFILFISLALFISAVFTFFFITRQREAYIGQMEREGRLLARLLADNARLAVFTENPELLKRAIESGVQYDNVRSVSVFDPQGKLLAEVVSPPSPPPPPLGAALSEIRKAPQLAVHLSDKRSVEFYSTIVSSLPHHREDQLYVDTPSAGPPASGILRVTVDKGPLDRRVGALLKAALLIAGGFVSIGSALTYLLLREMTRPLNRLIQGVGAVANGNLSERIEVGALDEIGKVSLAFNFMAETLERRNVENRELHERLREAQRIEAKREWERTFDALPDLVALLDRDHRVLRINRSMAARLDVPKERAAGRTPLELGIGMETHGLVGDTPAAGEATFSREMWSDSLGAHFEVTLSALMNGTEVCGYVFVARDISRRKKYEEEQRQMQAKLVQTNRMTSLGQMVTGIAHEINNPNNSIMLGSQLVSGVWRDALPILERCYQEEGEFYLGGVPYSEARETISRQIMRITESSRRIDGVIRNLRDFAVGRESFVSGVNLNKVVNFSVSILNNQIKKNVGSLELDLAEELPAVKGNPQQLEQVVMNLLMNAIQALPDAERGIRVSTSWDRENDVVLITVRDEGEGIAPEIMNRLFEPFFSTKLEKGGSGLGLSISNLIVTEHRGRLVLTSVPGEGTVASVSLPVANRPEAAVFTSSLPQPGEPRSPRG